MNNAFKNIVLYLQCNFVYFLEQFVKKKKKTTFLTQFKIISHDFYFIRKDPAVLH